MAAWVNASLQVGREGAQRTWEYGLVGMHIALQLQQLLMHGAGHFEDQNRALVPCSTFMPENGVVKRAVRESHVSSDAVFTDSGDSLGPSPSLTLAIRRLLAMTPLWDKYGTAQSMRGFKSNILSEYIIDWRSEPACF